MTTRCGLAAVLATIGGLGCDSFVGSGAAPDGGDGNDPPAGCVPGAAQRCACTDGRDGAQTCLGDRTFGPCVCDGDDPVDDPRTCEDERECRDGERCQLGVCVRGGAPDGGPDDVLDGGSDGVCGDARVDPGEQCDEGARNSDTRADACREGCRNAHCGDNVKDRGEACDGADFGGLTCAALGGTGALRCVGCRIDQAGCAPEPGACGDGRVDDGEQCDDGEGNSNTRADACRLDCRRARCGDGVRDTPEQCDASDFGGATCESLNGTRGTLRCGTTCLRDASDCQGGGDGEAGPDEPCARTAECREGLLCVRANGATTARCRFPCNDGGNCPGTYSCVSVDSGARACIPDSEILPLEGATCTSARGCAPELRCVITSADGTAGTCGRTCSAGVPCPEPRVCADAVDGGSDVCAPPPELCEPCAIDGDCGEGMTCRTFQFPPATICTYTCTQGIDCGGGNLCSPIINVCVCLGGLGLP
jgi:hypothetical protein